MTLPDLIRKTKPAIVSILAVLLCLLIQKWLQGNLRDGHHLGLKHPFFPYFPTVLYMGYLYGMRIGALTIATSALLLVVLFPEAVEDWRIGIPLYVILCLLSLRLIERLKHATEVERNHRKVQIDFMAMLAHEIKTPLATLETSAYSQSLMANSDLAATRLRNHTRALDDISNILERLLEMDAVEGQSVTVEPRSFQIRPLLIDIIDDTRWPERIDLSCVEDKPVVSDPVLLRRILTNLVDNALKYGPRESLVILRSTPERRKGKRGVAFRCINEISPSNHPDPEQVFSKYYRSTATSGISGAGVGLWLCKQFVDALSGVIQMELREDQISFYVWVPDLSS
jgi:signal transduction histidine kinase